jgi:hypothetical protein
MPRKIYNSDVAARMAQALRDQPLGTIARCGGSASAAKCVTRKVSADSSLADKMAALKAADAKVYEQWISGSLKEKCLADVLETLGLID